MLWYKAWLETKSRFLIALIGITAISSFQVFHGDRNALSSTTIAYYYSVLFGANQTLAFTWILAVTLLAMGGLAQENASGASAFTLALPVSRTRLIAVRIWMGLVQAVVLVVVPWTAMFWISTTLGKTHSLQQAFLYVLCLLGGGIVFFSLAILISTLVEGQYTAPSVSFGLAIISAVALADPPLHTFSPFMLMIGADYFDKRTGLLGGPLPWEQVCAYVGVAVIFLFVSVKALQNKEF